MKNLDLALKVKAHLEGGHDLATRLNEPELTRWMKLHHAQMNSVANAGLSPEDAATVGATAGTPEPDTGGTEKGDD